MEIYVVQQGDDIETIARNYGVSVERLISDNGLTNPNHKHLFLIIIPLQ